MFHTDCPAPILHGRPKLLVMLYTGYHGPKDGVLAKLQVAPFKNTMKSFDPFTSRRQTEGANTATPPIKIARKNRRPW
jgi:hypothetical protein